VIVGKAETEKMGEKGQYLCPSGRNGERGRGKTAEEAAVSEEENKN